MNSPTLIRLNNVSFRGSNKNTILQSVNLDIKRNEVISVVGPNGAGKSTLLRLVLGLEQANSGTIERQNNLRIGYVPQSFENNQQMQISSRDFLALGLSHPLNPHLVEKLQLEPILDRTISQLSGGECQRLLLARAVMRKPQLLVLDEPAQGVDIHGQALLYQMIDDIRKELECAVLLVSHDLHIVMATTDRVICLNKHICCHGHPEEISQHPEYVALFGKNHSSSLAVYNHHHDHHHDLGGQTHEGQCLHD